MNAIRRSSSHGFIRKHDPTPPASAHDRPRVREVRGDAGYVLALQQLVGRILEQRVTSSGRSSPSYQAMPPRRSRVTSSIGDLLRWMRRERCPRGAHGGPLVVREENGVRREAASGAERSEWAHLGSNQGPLACEASALPLSYAPGRGGKRSSGRGSRSLALAVRSERPERSQRHETCTLGFRDRLLSAVRTELRQYVADVIPHGRRR